MAAMEIPYFLVDAFASQPFAGAPTVVLVPQTAPDPAMLAPIVAELGAHDGAYLFHASDAFHLRWFDRRGELPLCTHATIAAAHTVFTAIDPGRTAVTFGSQAGPIQVASRDGLLVTDLPRLTPSPEEPPPKALTRALRVPPAEVLRAGKFVAVYRDEADLRAITPDPAELAGVDAPGIIATAPGQSCDFVCRTFALAAGALEEEQVSASAQSRLVPYWSKRLAKTSLRARQLSPRGAELFCEESSDGRIYVAGHAVRVARGTVYV
jgi:PhzF family phenazine biosynthesis protein